jgi:hypothetical protein
MYTLSPNTNHLVTLSSLWDVDLQMWRNDATVTADITDNNGFPMESLSLPYVAGSNGTYKGITSGTVNYVLGQPYVITILATAGSTRRQYVLDAEGGYAC